MLGAASSKGWRIAPSIRWNRLIWPQGTSAEPKSAVSRVIASSSAASRSAAGAAPAIASYRARPRRGAVAAVRRHIASPQNTARLVAVEVADHCRSHRRSVAIGRASRARWASRRGSASHAAISGGISVSNAVRCGS